MKKSLIATLVAAPVLAFSSMAHASEPVALTESQLDVVVAGANWSWIGQFNASPVTVVQVNAVTKDSNNVAFINSGNFAKVKQR